MKSAWALVGALFLYMGCGGSAGAAPKYGPGGNPWATPLSQDSSYFRRPGVGAPDYWAMAPYYVSQFNGAACSVASVTVVLNAARAAVPKQSETRLILQQDLLAQVSADWKKRIDPGWSLFGAGSVRGVTLELLGRFAEQAFRLNGFAEAAARVVHVENADPAALKRLRDDLAENEKSGSNFILANFDQKLLTDDTSVGHISPIAAYDSASRRVLVMDPDREWYEPYWVSDEQLLKAMATPDSESKKNRGYVVLSVNVSARFPRSDPPSRH